MSLLFFLINLNNEKVFWVLVGGFSFGWVLFVLFSPNFNQDQIREINLCGGLRACNHPEQIHIAWVTPKSRFIASLITNCCSSIKTQWRLAHAGFGDSPLQPLYLPGFLCRHAQACTGGRESGRLYTLSGFNMSLVGCTVGTMSPTASGALAALWAVKQ